MTIAPLATEAIVEGYEAVENLESLSQQELKEFITQATKYKASTDDVNTQDFLELVGTEFEGYASDFVLDGSIEAVIDDLDMRDVSVTSEMQTMLDRLEQRLATVLTA